MAKKPSKSTKSKNNNYDDMEEQEGHKQEGGEKVAEGDVDKQRAQQDDDPGDPFEHMMRDASRNARYTVAFIPNGGTVDKGDPMRTTPNEHDNSPRVKNKGKSG